MEQKCEKIIFIILFCRFLNSEFSKITGLNSSDQVSVEIFLAIMSFFVEVI